MAYMAVYFNCEQCKGRAVTSQPTFPTNQADTKRPTPLCAEGTMPHFLEPTTFAINDSDYDGRN